MKTLLLGFILMANGAFAASVQERQTERHSGMGAMHMMENCPMNLQGTNVATVDIPSGIAVSFTTKPESVVELRRRVERMAAMHSNGHPPEAPNQGMMQGRMIPGTVKYEAIENGARLNLTPKDPAKLTEFRAQVRAHVERMKTGDCSMMPGMMQGMSKPSAEPKAEPHER